jgi:hypothetical protein
MEDTPRCCIASSGKVLTSSVGHAMQIGEFQYMLSMLHAAALETDHAKCGVVSLVLLAHAANDRSKQSFAGNVFG